MAKAFNVERARFAQKVIASKVIESDVLPAEIKHVAGVDVAYSGALAIAAAAVVDTRTLKLVASSIATLKVHVPYIPTLLAFREAGPMIAVLGKLDVTPDVVMVDGNGRLHPFGAGIACQVGLAVDRPTIGVAKKLLCGEVGEWCGREAPVLLSGRVVGMALRTSAKPIYVSVGHKVSLPTAAALVLKLTRRGVRLPEPLRLAHEIVTKHARKAA